jgi:hypothetical protein
LCCIASLWMLGSGSCVTAFMRVASSPGFTAPSRVCGLLGRPQLNRSDITPAKAMIELYLLGEEQ